MDLISNSKPLTYDTESNNINKYKNSSNNNNHTVETSENSNLKDTAASNISDDAVTAYKFLNRIKDSVKDTDNSSFASKYTSEYKSNLFSIAFINSVQTLSFSDLYILEFSCNLLQYS